MDMKKLKAFVKFQEEKRELENKLKDVKEKLGDLQAALLKDFEKAGIQNMNVGGFTVYLARDVFAGPVIDKDDLIAALKKAKLGYLVKPTYHAQSLKAYAKKLDEAGKKMPPSLVGHLKITEAFKVAARKA